MSPERRQTIVYVTSNPFKKAEIEVLQESAALASGKRVREVFDFEIRHVQIKEVLEVDIREMVKAEVAKAYAQLKVPCIVEHAGLTFHGYDWYPGGLTKPMWDTLGVRFVDETGSKGRAVMARAVVAYCDGKTIYTFVGETSGHIADEPRGTRDFYWDTVFVPETRDTSLREKTYAEIVDDPKYGLAYKVLNLSQSTRAMLKFLEFRGSNPPALWSAYQ
jgi:inosine/xanthosine triphosphate pyrophosphatase family protein